MVAAEELPDANEKTYDSFVTLLKWTVPILAVTGLIVILLIS
jgi:hypothetical protein